MHWKRIAVFGVAFLNLSCVTNPPVYDEGILTLDPGGFDKAVEICLPQLDPRACILSAWHESIIGDFAASGGGTYVQRGATLDGLFLYSAASRANILKWAQARCK